MEGWDHLESKAFQAEGWAPHALIRLSKATLLTHSCPHLGCVQLKTRMEGNFDRGRALNKEEMATLSREQLLDELANLTKASHRKDYVA